MKKTTLIWGSAGFIVAAWWTLLALWIPLSTQPILLDLARFTCPIVPISWTLHFGVKWYWVLVTNVLAYALIGMAIGLAVKALSLPRKPFQAAPC